MTGLTEQEIIRILTNQFRSRSGVPLGYEDDVAAIPLSSKAWIIMKTDMLVGSTDLPPGVTLKETARKAVVATVSDFAAKGVRPRALMVSLGLPPPVTRKDIRELARGLSMTAQEYDCKIIGGDTNQADDLVIDIAGIGLARPNKLVRRDGARPGDIVAVTGPFGKSAAGLEILMSKRERDRAGYPSLVRAMRRPRARLTEGLILATHGGVTSSIDSSDGLAWSLHQIANASGVGMKLATIPIDHEVERFARERRLSALDLALYGGEEYELVVTIKPERFGELRRRVHSLRGIGTVERKRFGVSAQTGRGRFVIEARGWQHFT